MTCPHTNTEYYTTAINTTAIICVDCGETFNPRKETPMNEISNAELAKRIDILRDKVNALEKQIAAAPAKSDATPMKKLGGQLNGQDVWVYDIEGLQLKEDRNEPGRMIAFVKTKHGKTIPVDDQGIFIHAEQYELQREFADSLTK